MIYVSSACSREKTISGAVIDLVRNGYTNIELSGGIQFDPDYEKTVLELKEKYGLKLLLHNYFPPPREDFVLNLASLDDEIYDKSLEQLRKSLKLTQLLGGDKFGFHAGFFVDRPASELGKIFGKDSLSCQADAEQKFIETINVITKDFPDIKIYIENNCYSASNFKVYGEKIPFMLLCEEDYKKIQEKSGINLLLDIAHLKVCSVTLGFDFEQQLKSLFGKTNYIHISDNDGKHDQNLGLRIGSPMLEYLSRLDWADKIVTLEVYDGWASLEQSYVQIQKFRENQI